MVWSDSPPVAEIILPSDQPPGAVGTIYLGGPNLPTELQGLGIDDALIFYSTDLAATHIHYTFFAMNNSLGEFVWGYVKNNGTVVQIVSNTSDSVNFDIANVTSLVAASNVLDTIRTRYIEVLGIDGGGVFTGAKIYIQRDLGDTQTVRLYFENEDASGYGELTTSSTGHVALPVLRMLTPGTGIDEWTSNGIANGTAIFGTTVNGAATWMYRVTFDRVVEVTGAFTIVTPATTYTANPMPAAFTLPASIRPTGNTQDRTVNFIIGSGTTYDCIPCIFRPTDGTLRTLGTGVTVRAAATTVKYSFTYALEK